MSENELVAVVEENVTKILIGNVNRERRYTKHSVAPVNYQGSYNKDVYPRSAFTSGGLVVEAKIAKKSAGNLKDAPVKLYSSGIKLDSSSKTDIEKYSSFALSDKLHKLGERGSGFRTKGEPQDFYKLRDYHLANGTLFEDPEFPPTDSSLFYSQRPDRNYQWKRPAEIVDEPQFFVEGFSRFDVQQGELGDCWLLAAAANLTLYRRLFFQIVPDDQCFEDKYAGIFHFRFWQYGRWIDVVIDDRLPTYNRQLVFLRSAEDNEFWSALLEKAYAKLHGSYEALRGGSTCEAMEDFTGGVCEMYEMSACPPNLFQIILKAFERSSLMGCSIESKRKGKIRTAKSQTNQIKQRAVRGQELLEPPMLKIAKDSLGPPHRPDPDVLEAQTPEGLVRGHAYSITSVKFVNIQTPNVTGKIPLLRLRNPWGNESEWNGPWSDGSPEWRFISDSEKEGLGLTFDNDGEFWMSYKDFQHYFTRLEICNLNPDSLSEEELLEGHKKRWEMGVFEGEWVRGVSAGGCRNFLDSFSHNPQYRVTLTEVDEGDDDGNCTLIVALMQKNRRQMRHTVGAEILTIGFAIYHLSNPDRLPKPLDRNFFKYNSSVARSPSFINLREVSCRFKLPPGSYAIVPSTFDPNQEGEFLLRVFSENKNNMEENDTMIGITELDERVPVEETAEEKDECTRANSFFLSFAGEDGEIDWEELQKIMNSTMQSEKTIHNKTNINGVNAAQTTTGGGDQISGLFNTIIGLICGTFCKNTPLAEFIATPTQTSPLNASFAELGFTGFSKDICRSMVAMLDSDRSGKLGFEEFKELWSALHIWKNVWTIYDKDHSGTMSGFELREAMHSVGYNLNNKLLNALMHRYGNKLGEIHFEDFMMCAIKVKTMLKIYDEKVDLNASPPTVTFHMDEWLETTLYT